MPGFELMLFQGGLGISLPIFFRSIVQNYQRTCKLQPITRLKFDLKDPLIATIQVNKCCQIFILQHFIANDKSTLDQNYSSNILMEKQKLAELVLQKMKQKKEQEQRSRPHYEVLRLQATFQKEMHDYLKAQIAQFQALLGNQRKALDLLQQHQSQLDNTGKKNYPRIVIMPDFIASEKISSSVKEFYRKTSNSFLRTDILRTKAFDQSVSRQKDFLQKLRLIQQLENQTRCNIEQDRKIMNQKRVKVLKQDLRLRSIKEDQKEIQRTIQKQRQQNKDLLKQYEVKKLNLQNRKERLKYVLQQIETYKNKIEQAFNPVTYRQHLQQIFDIQVKTQRMQKHLAEVVQNTGALQKETEKYQKILQKTASLSVLGRTSDSPSTRKGKIQKRLKEEKQKNEDKGRRAQSQLNSREQQHRRSVSQRSLKRQTLDLDINKILSTAKNSQRTTDRSSHPRFHSDLARSLF